jgi:polyferredoxin
MEPAAGDKSLATPAAPGASWSDVAQEVRVELARERRDLAERIIQNAAYLLVVVPALVVLGLVTVMLSLVALGAVVAVLVQLPWTVTAFFALVIAGLLAAYRGSEPRCVDPFAQPSDDRDWPRLGSR